MQIGINSWVVPFYLWPAVFRSESQEWGAGCGDPGRDSNFLVWKGDSDLMWWFYWHQAVSLCDNTDLNFAFLFFHTNAVVKADRQHWDCTHTEDDWPGKWQGNLEIFDVAFSPVLFFKKKIENVLYPIISLLLVFIINFCILLQELFSKQKGFLEEELDYRKQALDQAYMVWGLHWSYQLQFTEFGKYSKQNMVCES